MTAWTTTREEWWAWAVEAVPAAAPLDRIDDFDGSLAARLERARFPAGDETTAMRPSPTGSFDSMTTLIREAPVDPAAPDSITVVTPGPGPQLTVDLVPPDGPPRIEVTLRPPGAEPAIQRAGLDAEPAASVPHPERNDFPEEVVEAGADDEMFIPSLTKSAATAADLPPPPEASFDEASAPEAIGVMHGWEGARASGELGAPSEPEPEPEPPQRRVQVAATRDPSASQTSGVIQMGAGDDEAATTMVNGQRDAEPRVAKAKIVVDPSASGMFERVHDEDVGSLHEAEAEPDEEEVAQELDEDDLEETAAPAPPPSPPALEVVPEPAPEVPPPPRPARPAAAATVDGAALAGAEVRAPPPARTGQTVPPQGGDLAWVDAAFGEHYFALLPDNREARAQSEVGFVLACTRTPAGARVLDVGCGDGAHAFAFAARGMQVTAFDASMAQLLHATQQNEARGNPVALLQGDMRDPPVQGSFALVTCLGSTFGYFDDETNERVLRRLAACIAPGGHLVLHVFNRERMVGRLPARAWWQGRGCLVLDEAGFDSLASRLSVHRTIVFEDGRQFDHTVTMRAFGLADLRLLCERVGLQLVEYSGGIHTRGRFFGATSADIWWVARRPET